MTVGTCHTIVTLYSSTMVDWLRARVGYIRIVHSSEPQPSCRIVVSGKVYQVPSDKSRLYNVHKVAHVVQEHAQRPDCAPKPYVHIAISRALSCCAGTVRCGFTEPHDTV